MKYLLLSYLDESAWESLGAPRQQQLMQEGIAYAQQLRASGKFLGGSPLHPVTAATSLRIRDGRKIVTDGPFAETREQLAGYSIVDVESRQEAIDIALRLIGAGPATVEVRPLWELPGLPGSA